MADKVTNKKIVSVNFSRAVFSILDFLILEIGFDRLSRNVGKELPQYAAQHPRRALISHDDLAVQGLAWL